MINNIGEQYINCYYICDEIIKLYLLLKKIKYKS